MHDDLKRRLHDEVEAELGFRPPQNLPEVLNRGRSKRLALRVMTTMSIVVVGTALVAGGLAIGRSVSSDGAVPVPPAKNDQGIQPLPGARFNSTIHGISIDRPSGWQTRPATKPWTGGRLTFGAPDVDVIFDPALEDDLYFALVSEPLNGRAWDQGFAWLEKTGICSDATGGNGGAYKLDGASGWIQSCSTDVEGDHSVAVATATRGYIMQLHVGSNRLLETYDGDWFEEALDTVDLGSE